MRTISAGLKAAILTGKIANLVKITRSDATVYSYTDHDLPLTVGGITYNPAPGLQRLRLEATVDNKVSNQQFNAGWLDFDDQDLKSGLFDNAEIEVQKCAWDELSEGTITTFFGHLGIIQWTEDGFKADVHSITRELGRNYGITTTASCRHRLFDQIAAGKCGACTIIKASNTFTGSITSIVKNNIRFQVTGTFPTTQDYVAFGELTFTSGLNNGLTFEVSKHDIGAFSEIELMLQTFANVQVGDTFNVTSGCDKSFSTCINKYNNGLNYGGMPHIQSEIMFR